MGFLTQIRTTNVSCNFYFTRIFLIERKQVWFLKVSSCVLQISVLERTMVTLVSMSCRRRKNDTFPLVNEWPPWEQQLCLKIFGFCFLFWSFFLFCQLIVSHFSFPFTNNADFLPCGSWFYLLFLKLVCPCKRPPSPFFHESNRHIWKMSSLNFHPTDIFFYNKDLRFYCIFPRHCVRM